MVILIRKLMKRKQLGSYQQLAKYKQLFFDGTLTVGKVVDIDKPLAKRLGRVLRLRQGDEVVLFNGKDGLFKAKIASNDCRQIEILSQLKPFSAQNNVTLLSAVVKKDAMDRIFRHATELGITTIQPCLTEYCVVNKINEERVTSLLVEASEQCERLDIPTLKPLINLKQAVENFSGTIFWGDEVAGGKWGNHTAKNGDGILIGPEGGFSPKEREFLQQLSNVQPIGLGGNILRADTATAVACGLFFESLEINI
jgi:16S rRNA (uracil1498-N3)-methyltransferase